MLYYFVFILALDTFRVSPPHMSYAECLAEREIVWATYDGIPVVSECYAIVKEE